MSAEVRKTTCVMDCPDACALEVEVEEGRIRRIGGAQESTTAGFICSKVSRFARRVEHPDRLLHPMRRVGAKGGGRFEELSWEEAVDAIASRLGKIRDRWGGEAILPYHYGGSNGFVSDGSFDNVFFARLGASRLKRTLCAAPATAVQKGLYGSMPGVAYQDFPKARFIVVWGANPKTSQIHLVPWLKRAKKNGAFIAAVDPQCHFSEREIDLHVPVFPGGDLPLALGMIRWWRENGLLARDFLLQHAQDVGRLLEAADGWTLERASQASRVDADVIEHLAGRYAQSSPALVRCGWGLERNRNGGQAIAAILAMPALLGKFGVRGGGYTLSNGSAVSLPAQKVFGEVPWKTRELNMTRLGAILNDQQLSPPVKGLFVYNCNPVATAPNQNAVLDGLAREDLFTVVHEQVMTDTCQWADIVLPATTFLEHRDIRRGYGAYRVGGTNPVVEPAGQARPNEAVFAALGRAMGFRDECFRWDSQTAQRKLAEALRVNGDGPQPDAYARGEGHQVAFEGAPGPVQMRDVRPATSDGRIHLAPPQLGPRPYRWDPVEDGRYPLALISPATSKTISSTLGEFNYPELKLLLHAEDAMARGLESGDTVRVFNDLGEVVCRLEVGGRVRPGVAALPKGAWRKASRNAKTAVALCPDTVNEVGGGACFNDARVQVEKA